MADDTANSVRAALARGDLLAAYDEARARRPASPALNYLEVLTLARLGDTERALKLYGDYRLEATGEVDALSLKARLLKDQAFAAAGAGPDRAKLCEACKLYAAVFRRTRSSYPAINAATLAQLAGRKRLAAMLARAATRAVAAEGRDDYFSHATLAEGRVILGDLDGARAALSRAVGASDADVGARSTTFLQFQRLIASIGEVAEADSLLEPIRPPRVAMFCGNIFVADPPLEARLAAAVRAAIAQEQIGFAYGALAAGSDILIAEQLIAAGAELHVVLPFAEADFLEQSVAPGGDEWLRRYAHCRSHAASVTVASNMSYVGEMGQFAYGSKVTMGMARLRARHLNGEAVQLAIVEETGKATLSGSDIAAWRAGGCRAVVVTAPSFTRPKMPPPPASSSVARGTYGLMFTDFPGFTSLDERVLPIFWEEVMGRAAVTLENYAQVIRHGSTWGDALYVVFDDATSAAAAALDLSDQFSKVNCQALGVPDGTAMRIALHYGATYSARDPITGRTTFYGTEVSRTARIEPVTPGGSVYVTEPFAAVLEMESDPRFACSYVGKTELAKGYGVYPLYRLSKAAR